MFEVGDIVKCVRPSAIYPRGETEVTDVSDIEGEPAVTVKNSSYKAFASRYKLVSRAKEITEEDLKGLV